MSAGELIDIVNYNDQPTGSFTTKEEAHQKGHLHRIAAVLVFTPSGKLLVQQHKQWQRRMDHSVGGHVIAGEQYLEAAKREMAEELGLIAEIDEVGTVNYPITHYEQHDPMVRHAYGVFEAKAPKDWIFIPHDEVDQLIEMEIGEIIDTMNRQPDLFLKGFLTSFAAYLKATGSKDKILAYGKDWGEL